MCTEANHTKTPGVAAQGTNRYQVKKNIIYFSQHIKHNGYQYLQRGKIWLRYWLIDYAHMKYDAYEFKHWGAR